MSKQNYVLDASLLLCLINKEKGYKDAVQYLHNSVMSTVNVCEVITVLTRAGLDVKQAGYIIKDLVAETIPFDKEQAIGASKLYVHSKKLGLSPGRQSMYSLMRNIKHSYNYR